MKADRKDVSKKNQGGNEFYVLRSSRCFCPGRQIQDAILIASECIIDSRDE